MDRRQAQTLHLEQPHRRDSYTDRESQPRPLPKYNRHSLQSDGPSVDTNSPFQSPVSPEFPQGAGLAPRPSSFPYGDTAPNAEVEPQFSTTSRKPRQSERSGRRLSLDKPLPPVPPPTSDAPRGQPPLSYRDPIRSNSRSMAQPSAHRNVSSKSKDADIGRSSTRTRRSAADQRPEPNTAQRVFVNGRAYPRQPIPDDGATDSERLTDRGQPRRDSATDPGSHQRREWAPDRSPLQKLELTLQDISKEEKRAQVEEAQLVARDTRAGRGSQSRRSGRPSTTSYPPPAPSDNDHLAEAGLVRNLSHKQKDRLQRSATIESKKPGLVDGAFDGHGGDFEYQEQEYTQAQSNGASRKLSHRRQASINDRGPPGFETTERSFPGESQPLPTSSSHIHDRTAASNTNDPDLSKAISGPGELSETTTGVKYSQPPQTASAIEARQRVGTGPGALAPPQKKLLGDYLHLHHKDRGPSSTQQPMAQTVLDEWRGERVVRLTRKDLRVEALPAEPPVSAEQKTWWEQNPRATSNSKYERAVTDGVVDESNSKTGFAVSEDMPTSFEPELYLKSGPLLRFTGISTGPTPVWRGTVLIVTKDSASSYAVPPTLQLCAEPKSLLPPPPPQIGGETGELQPEYVDPIAGLPKMTRTGGIVYVKPVEHLDERKDLSTIEDDTGLFQATLPRPETHPNTDANGASQKPPRSLNGKVGTARAIPAIRLHTERDTTFWRFKLEVELTDRQTRIAYRINNGPPIGFWIPARGENMNLMFHSCNGFSQSVDPNTFSGPDPMWRDVLNTHQTSPFHAMIGGGDQIYCDKVSRECPLFEEWLNIRNPVHKHGSAFTPQLQEELESWYLEHYCDWFFQGLFGMAASQIPMVNIWDDHDIIDGFGSYPHHFMSAPIFAALGAIAFKYYMLFQHQSVPAEAEQDEPSWLLGASRGPYINELSRSVFIHFGPNIAFLGLDCRTERMRDEILSEDTYDLIFDRCDKEIMRGTTKHLIVLLGVPIAYPRLVFLEQILTSRLMDPVKALGRTGMLGGFLNKFDGGVEILDDVDDHWTAKGHKEERNWLLQELQELAAAKSVRITILSGDVHLAAVGRFYSNPRVGVPKDEDHRYMYNVISSAIVNTPPPDMMGDILNKRNKIHHLDRETDEDMIPIFTHDVDGKSRNNKRLLPRRNWCSIKEYHHGRTPPPTPPTPEPDLPPSPKMLPGRLTRTFSISKGDTIPGKLVRRLSNRGGRPSYISPRQGSEGTQSPGQRFGSSDNNIQSQRSLRSPTSSAPPGRTPFHRQPTDLGKTKFGRKLANQGKGHVNFEQGLEIVLNLEVSQDDPAGITTPYRLLVPALWYSGEGDLNPLSLKKKGLLQWGRRLSIRGPKVPVLEQGGRKGSYVPEEDSEGADPAHMPNRGLEH
ncbi:MAG: hypothetical protein M1814_002032 [Vezdaea aestivalis]|nr:MAG: hypothetical protein M1814_002032 [Vezdaea aestivalis]